MHYYKGNPSKLPYICIVWLPPNGSHVMTPETRWRSSCGSRYIWCWNHVGNFQPPIDSFRRFNGAVDRGGLLVRWRTRCTPDPLISGVMAVMGPLQMAENKWVTLKINGWKMFHFLWGNLGLFSGANSFREGIPSSTQKFWGLKDVQAFWTAKKNMSPKMHARSIWLCFVGAIFHISFQQKKQILMWDDFIWKESARFLLQSRKSAGLAVSLSCFPRKNRFTQQKRNLFNGLYTPRKTWLLTMEKQTFENVFSLKSGDFLLPS